MHTTRVIIMRGSYVRIEYVTLLICVKFMRLPCVATLAVVKSQSMRVRPVNWDWCKPSREVELGSGAKVAGTY